MPYDFLQQFNNRELSIFTWIVVFIWRIYFSKTFKRLNIRSIVVSFFNWKIYLPIVILIAYQIWLVVILYDYDIWNFDLLKDTIYGILWVIGILLSLHKQKENFTKNFFIRLFEFSLIIEILSSTYVFSYGVELILVFVVVFLSMLIAYSKYYKEYKLINTYAQYLINTIYILYFIFLIKSTLSSPWELLEYNTIIWFLLPIFLTTFSFPLIFLCKLIMEYEVLFVRMSNIFRKETSFKKKIKLEIVRLCKFNLGKLSKISNSNLWFHQSTETEEDYKNLISEFHKLI